MSLILKLSKDAEATLASQARAAHMPTGRYVAHLVERALELHRHRVARDLEQHLDSMASRIAPETTLEEMESALGEALANVRPQRTWHQ